MRSKGSWHMSHGQWPRECQVARYRHGCDPPKPAEVVLDCDPLPSSLSCLSDQHFSPSAGTRRLRMALLMLTVGCSTPPTYEDAFSDQHEINWRNSDSRSQKIMEVRLTNGDLTVCIVARSGYARWQHVGILAGADPAFYWTRDQMDKSASHLNRVEYRPIA